MISRRVLHQNQYELSSMIWLLFVLHLLVVIGAFRIVQEDAVRSVNLLSSKTTAEPRSPPSVDFVLQPN